MKPVWDDAIARARGLSTHLLGRGALEALSHEPDLSALAAGLRRAGIPSDETAGSPPATALELAIRRWSAAQLRTLARWLGGRAAALPLVFEAEDLRSLRAIFRGVAAHVPAERRLAGLIPTPTLPERALQALAAASTSGAVAALLSAWHHPWAGAIAAASSASEVDLFALETALAQASAATTGERGARARNAGLRTLVRESIDLENALTALVLSSAGRDVDVDRQFVRGGGRLSLPAFREAIVAGGPGPASMRLARAFDGTGIARLFALHSGEPAILEVALRRRHLKDLTLRSRMAPLGPVPLVWFAFRLHMQVLDLQRIVWTVALGAPRLPLAGTFVAAS